MISIVVAMDKNGGIGKDNSMPWHFKKDMRYFKELTWGHPVIMGRKTFDSLPERFKPLPGRENIVLTRKESFGSGYEDVISFDSVDKVLNYCKNKDCFVIGGAEVYKAFLPYADRLYITYIDAEYEVDTHFPAFDKDDFVLLNEQRETENGVTLRFVVLERKSK